MSQFERVERAIEKSGIQAHIFTNDAGRIEYLSQLRQGRKDQIIYLDDAPSNMTIAELAKNIERLSWKY